MVAQFSGLKAQDVQDFVSILPSLNVDISTDDIVRIAEELQIQNPSEVSSDIIKKLEDTYPTMNTTQKYVLSVISRAMMNMMLRIYEHPDVI